MNIELLGSGKIVTVDMSARQAYLLGLGMWCGRRDKDRTQALVEAYTGVIAPADYPQSPFEDGMTEPWGDM